MGGRIEEPMGRRRLNVMSRDPIGGREELTMAGGGMAAMIQFLTWRDIYMCLEELFYAGWQRLIFSNLVRLDSF